MVFVIAIDDCNFESNKKVIKCKFVLFINLCRADLPRIPLTNSLLLKKWRRDHQGKVKTEGGSAIFARLSLKGGLRFSKVKRGL